jgi:hypothetical protein
MPLARQTVDVRRFVVGVAVTAKICIAEVIRENENQVRLTGKRRCREDQRQEQAKKSFVRHRG